MAALLFSTVAFADTVAADGDLVADGSQGTVDLGSVAPGATIDRDVAFTLVCAGLRHVDPGQVVTVSPSTVTAPSAGGSASATDGSIGPVPDTWVNDSAGIVGCPSSLRLFGATPSHVSIVAPSIPGEDYAFTILYGKSLSPAGVADGSSVGGGTGITFMLDVEDADTTPPTLVDVPSDLDVITNDPAGTALDYIPPTATDDRDPSPVVACDPAPGDLVPVGSTAITCTATDAAGNQATATFRAVVHLAVVMWQDPIRAGTVEATRGRTLPVKVRAWLDGAVPSGTAELVVTGCETIPAAAPVSPARTIGAARQADANRWMALLDTSGLAEGCHLVELILDGQVLGVFTLDIVVPPTSTSGWAWRGFRPG